MNLVKQKIERMARDQLTDKILGCAITVSNTLGAGFMEKVYENALAIELRNAGLKAEQQKPIAVSYRGMIVGDYAADILVDDAVILELKVAKAIDSIHEAQLLNYLKATGLHVGLILNFGTSKMGIKRMVLGEGNRLC
jgi:GxxExxY protein